MNKIQKFCLAGVSSVLLLATAVSGAQAENRHGKPPSRQMYMHKPMHRSMMYHHHMHHHYMHPRMMHRHMMHKKMM